MDILRFWKRLRNRNDFKKKKKTQKMKITENKKSQNKKNKKQIP